MRFTTRLLLFCGLSLTTLACAHTPQMQAEYRQFAEEMAQKHGFDAQAVTQLLNETTYRDDIIKAITRPAESKAWYEYRPIFIKQDRIDDGVAFWQENETLLKQVSQETGVPPEIIVAIIGVETRYGRFTGRHRVIDALTTLAFGYPKRAKFFRNELEEFLLLTREEQVDPRTATGSYAGAMGKPQFISSSYRAYAVDHDGDNKRDLWNSNADIIASVANYFKVHGWQAGQPITFQVNGGSDLDAIIAAGTKPKFTWEALLAKGVKPLQETSLPPDTLVSLIKLDGGDADEYWVGLTNFYVITRYNTSNLYAMAAYQLSQAIRQAWQATQAKQ
ncbi:MAG: lytic murein transglycosylase B [Candidatus Thiodiazotropha sp.]|jgi:membrane-bound lytic murein transglycosylase B